MVKLMNQWKDLSLAAQYVLEPVFDRLLNVRLNVRLAYVYVRPIS